MKARKRAFAAEVKKSCSVCEDPVGSLLMAVQLE